MVKAKRQRKPISNRRANFDYDLKDNLVVGVELNGAETKAVRSGQANLKGAYVNILNNELWLINATINGSNSAPINSDNQTRTRKLLAKRHEINQLIAAKKAGLTIVPLTIINDGRYIKIKIATGSGRKKYDKRAVIKSRDENRRIQKYSHNR